MTAETLIIGGGVSGLYAAHLLHQRGQSFRILESRDRHGGRVRSEIHSGIPLELGPSWIWPETNPRIASLIEELSLPTFSHYNEGDILIDTGYGFQRQSHQAIDPRRSMRLSRGTRSLPDALSDSLPEDTLLTGHCVQKITHGDHGITVTAQTDGGEKEFLAHSVIVALPLRLIEKTLEFTPPLPASLTSHFQSTPTWMAGEAKFFALYETPFWREDGLSGTSFSRTGPLAETHDASHPDGPGALFGFFNLNRHQRQASQDQIEATCLQQLTQFFGPQAASPITTTFHDWATEPFTATDLDGDQSALTSYALPPESSSLWHGALQFAGTEAAPLFGGYLEGALESAEHAVAAIARIA